MMNKPDLMMSLMCSCLCVGLMGIIMSLGMYSMKFANENIKISAGVSINEDVLDAKAKAKSSSKCLSIEENDDVHEIRDKLEPYYSNGESVAFILEAPDGLVLCVGADHHGDAVRVNK